ncbi:LOW QUALITY PROTEIN: ubiquitin carboxyl-terminal hydrolase 24-like [Palaemon carinicauda]|uniref:LOW QUALITY PROTEIN: ubiquitin carboxyl-terminal hydrolase 24-like n=1 Tax=Palaemon carinicauda TaxID=392227 RepID=UPI0035B6A0F4
MEQEDENISLLLNMGFPDVRAIKRALKMSNGDVNEAVISLTEQPLTSYNTVGDLRDVDMADSSGAPPSYEEVEGDNGNNMEFPTTNLYELEGRVFTETWSIPYKREESLGKCLIAAARLAEEGLCDADESCHRFLERCLPECFQKLLANGAVRRWGPEIQEGVFNMLDLLTNLVIVRLKHGPVPETLLKNIYALALDSECEWNQKNKHRPSDFVGDKAYAESTSQLESYGWLIDLINIFGNRGGFELIASRFASQDQLDAGQMAALLVPIGQCARFLIQGIICPILQPAVTQALNYVANLEEKQLKCQKIGSCYELLEAVRMLCVSLWPDEVQYTNDLRLKMIIRMLKTPHFSARMNALKELARLIEDSERSRSTGTDADLVQEWMTTNSVLSLALEGNIDQVQYTDRMKELVEFMGPKLQEDELTRIWQMAEQAGPHVVDNIHRIMAAAASRFNPHQFDHLLTLVRKSWDTGNDRLREKLLSFIGKIGKDSRLGRTAEKMLDTLWELARVPALPPRLVHQAMNEHLVILNKSATRDQLRKSYIVRCVEDIKRSPAVYLPLKQLHYLAQSITKGGGASYFKTEKATLSELNRSHEIVKLITQSLAKCHALAVSTSGQQPPPPSTLIDGKYTHDDYMKVHLEFLQFLLKEGDIYLAWARCKDIWDTLVGNPKASGHDKEVSTSLDAETCFTWFSGCLGDLEFSTQRELFCEKLLRLDPASITRSAFTCFVDYFYAVNVNDHKFMRSGNTLIVDKLEPLGMEFIWQLVLECVDEQLADDAIKLLLDMSYMSLSMRLKRDPPQLHGKFISECYKKLEKSMLRVNETAVGAAVSTATKTLTAMAVSDIGALPAASKSSCMQHIRRVLILAERYISNIEELHPGSRSLPPHGTSFTGTPFILTVTCDSNRMDIKLECHSNERIGLVRAKIANHSRVSVDQVQTLTFGDGGNGALVNGAEQDNRLLHHLGIFSNTCVLAKINLTGTAQLKEVSENWDELPGTASYTDTPEASSSDGASGSGASGGTSRHGGGAGAAAAVGDGHGSQYNLEQEKQLPGVVMASQGRDVFAMLYQLAQLDEPKIVEAVRHVLYLIPTDPNVSNKFDSICSAGTSSEASPRTTPYGSPAKKDKIRDKEKDRESGKEVLRSLLDPSSPDITPFRLLYNLEVLSGKIMAIASDGTVNGNAHFCEEFLLCGGMSLISTLLQRDSLPQEVDYEIRQSVYLITLQILRYVLCGAAIRGQELPVSNLQPHPGPPKRSALDSSAQAYPSFSSISFMPVIANRIVSELSSDEWCELVSSLMRVSWAGAAGKLYLSSAVLTVRDPALSPPDSKSSRQSSTGSTHSSSSDSEGILQGGVCVQQATIPPIDSLIASQALYLLIACLRFRPQLLERWYSMVSVKDFIIEVLVGCSCEEVRQVAYQQLTNLIKISTTASVQPSHFLTQVLLKAPLPLWVTSTSARGATLRLLSQCTQYFNLRSKLLSRLSSGEQELLGISALQMLEDETGWLTNFTATREACRERPESGIASLRHADNILLAGHLTLISALLTCEGVNKEENGATLIPLLITEYLFPASKLVLETSPEQDSLSASRNYWAKCTGRESRIAAYELLVHLVTNSEQNMTTLSSQLVSLHHTFNPNFLKEYEYAPAVDGRCASGYVGLKNGGATCYMNSVLQQLFMVQGVPEDILGITSDEENEDSLFYQLQTVFGHLMESQLQYYVPDQFWKCFRMDGQPVNVREQQDAFEFYTRLTEQVDDYLKSKGQESVFARRFEGVYSIQRICQDCPHRYEREEPFLALNLTVTKCHDLQDSLDQFVKGELLEGDNAYYCEKCNQKRTALIRTCVKTLPPVLVIQLKRFGYDWEASRALKFDDYFKFPWALDMGMYTADGIAEQEEDPGGGRERDRTVTPPLDHNDIVNSSKLLSSQSPLSAHTPSKSSKSSTSGSPHTPRINSHVRHRGIIYELVGVIVHSGQASAGHYYSYIKDRRGDPLTNPNKGRWFKFNDTTVEPVEMTDSLLEQECFGGTYKAKVSYDSSNPLPEDRLRYWNGYMLVYDSTDDRVNTPKTPKTPRVGVTSKSFRASTSSARKSLSMTGGSIERRARTSLCELTHLLQQGERQGMFREHMPPRILSMIMQENLTFLKNRDVYSTDYYTFIHQLCSTNLEKTEVKKDGSMSVQAVYLGLNFLLNTYLRTKDKEENTALQWGQLLLSLLQYSREACSWVVNYFASEDGAAHIGPLLLECPDKSVRCHFSILLGNIFKCEFEHSGGVESVEQLVKYILSLLASDVPAAVKTSYQYFNLLFSYVQQGFAQAHQILKLGGFSALVNFLLGPPEPDKRRWSSVQAQDFGPLHCTIATIISACNMTPYQTSGTQSDSKEEEKTEKLEMPEAVAQVLYGSDQSRWLREAVVAYREVTTSIPSVTNALKEAATENSSFTNALIVTVMTEYASKAPSNMLKELSQLLLEILNIKDSLKSNRTNSILEGLVTVDGEQVMGLLDIIDTNKDSDSRRAYQCIKLVVMLSARCPIARDLLTSTQNRWQWAVEWLRGRMDDHSVTVSTTTGLSNEDSSTKNFQRTTSAQLTLEEATALLSELESTEMEIDCDAPELGDIKESTCEREISPSQDLDAIDP